LKPYQPDIDRAYLDMLTVRQSAELSTGTGFHATIFFKTAPSAGYTLPPEGETGRIDHRR